MRSNKSIDFNNNGLVSGYYTQFLNGSDVNVYIDTFEIKEVGGILIQKVEQNIPYFGYDSKYFDYVFQGRSYVTGSILIGVHTPQYLYKVLSYLGYAYNTKEESYNVGTSNILMDMSEEELLETLSRVDIDDLDVDRDDVEGDFVGGRNFNLVIKSKNKDNPQIIKLKHVYINGYKSTYTTDDAVYETYQYIAREVVSYYNDDEISSSGNIY